MATKSRRHKEYLSQSGLERQDGHKVAKTQRKFKLFNLAAKETGWPPSRKFGPKYQDGHEDLKTQRNLSLDRYAKAQMANLSLRALMSKEKSLR